VAESGEGDVGTGARIAEIAARIGELDREVYAADDLARSGAIISMDYGGRSRVVYRGYVRPEDGNSDGEAYQAKAMALMMRTETQLRHRSPLPSSIPNACRRPDGAAHCSPRLEFANKHHVALTSVVHSLLSQTVLTHSRDHSCLDIVLTSRSVEVA